MLHRFSRLLLALCLTVGGTVAAVSTSGSTAFGADPAQPGPGVTIASPIEGAFVDEGDLLAGSVDAFGVDPIDTAVIFIIDTSGSVNSSAGVDCTGNGRSDTVYTCQIAAARAVVDLAAEIPGIVEVGGGRYSSSASVFDASPEVGLQYLTAAEPGTVDYLKSRTGSRVGGGTNFDAGLGAACTIASQTTATDVRILFMSDGFGSGRFRGCTRQVRVDTFAIGTGASCNAGLGLIALAAGGECIRVLQPDELLDSLTDLVAPEVVSATVSINGGEAVDLEPFASKPFPSVGFDYSWPMEGLAGGVNEICVTATAERLGERVSTTECVTVLSNATPDADAGPDQIVAEGAVVTLDASGSSDPNDDLLTYSWSIASQGGPPIALTATQGEQVSFVALDDGQYTFEVAASDGTYADTDTVQVNVENAAPAFGGDLQLSTEGGLALVTSSFSDPGALDVHAVSIDWGDGTPVVQVPVTTQGVGWGSFIGSHRYAAPGTYDVVVVLADSDGATVTQAAAGGDVSEAAAIWVGDTKSKEALDISGSNIDVMGRVRSNAGIKIGGSDIAVSGSTTYRKRFENGGGSNSFVPAAIKVAGTEPPPIDFALGDYQPGGRAAIAAGDDFHDATSECDDEGKWERDVQGTQLESGLWWVPCEVVFNASDLGGQVTIVSNDKVEISGSDGTFLEPYIDGLYLFSSADEEPAIKFNGSTATYAGYVVAPNGQIEISGSDIEFACGVWADKLKVGGSNLTFAGRQCGPLGGSGVADPLVVPQLDVAVDDDATAVTPGDTVTSTITVAHAGTRLFVPAVIGAENLGDQAVTINDLTVELEYLAAGAAAWTTLDVPLDIALVPNSDAAVSYPASGATGTTIGANGLASWGFQVDAFIDAEASAFLLDPAQVDSLRLRSEFTFDNPAGQPVRQLSRFSDDVLGAARVQGAALSDVEVPVISRSGSATVIDSSTEPALASLEPGDSVAVTDVSSVRAIVTRGATESADQYLERLASLDGLPLITAAYGRASAGIGGVLAPFVSSTVTQSVPRLDIALDAPLAVEAGTDGALDVIVTNPSTATASALIGTGQANGPVAFAGLPTQIAPSGLASDSATFTLPVDAVLGFDAAGSVTWADANGNPYGPVERRQAVGVLTAPQLAATLVDSLQVDADSDGLPSPGDTLRYELDIRNDGGTPLTTVVAELLLDDLTTPVAGSVTTTAGNVSIIGQVLTAPIASIAAGGSVAITVDAVVDDPYPSTGEPIEAQATITADVVGTSLSDDPTRFGQDNPTLTFVVVPDPVLEFALDADVIVDGNFDGEAGAGDRLRYSAVITNRGGQANDVVVTIPLDSDVTLDVGSLASSAGMVTSDAATITAQLGTLDPLASVTVAFQVEVDDPVQAGAAAVLQGEVTATGVLPIVSDDPDTTEDFDPTVVALVVGDTTTVGGSFPTLGSPSIADGQIVTAPTPVAIAVGTDPADEVAAWSVTIYESDMTVADGIVIGEGVGTPPAEWATIDPTVLSNGQWIVRFEAVGLGGDATTVETSIAVEGRLKLGRNSITYRDLEVNVGGFPVQVLRSYDTLDRRNVGDFGFGWSLDLADFRVDTNTALGQGPYELVACNGTGSIFSQLCNVTNGQRAVTVTWPDGEVEVFDFAPTSYQFFTQAATVKFEPRDGVTSRLEAVQGELTLLRSGGGNLVDVGTLDPWYDPSQFVLVAKDGTRYLLDDEQGLVSATDLAGNTITVSPDGITSSNGASLTLSRDNDGRITAAEGPDGEIVTYSYDANGDLESVTDANAAMFTHTYAAGHLLEQIDDPGPGVFRSFSYGPDGRLTGVTDSNGNTTTLDADPNDRTEIVTSSDGLLTTITTRDARGNELSTEEVYGGESYTTSFTYDPDDLITSRTDAEGATTSYSYDADQNLVSVTDGLGAVSSATYNARGQQLTVTDRTGATSSYTYDSAGRMTSMTDAVGASTSYTYDAAGNLSTKTDALGNETTWTYDAARRPITVTDPLGNVTSTEYDDAGRATSFTDAEGAVTSYGYDAVGNLVTATDALSRVTTYTYDGRGLVVSEADPAGAATSYIYDGDGNLTRREDPTGRVTVWTYVDGRLATEIAPDGGITTYAYDPGARLESVTDPVGAVTSYTYDGVGRQTSVTRPSGAGLATSNTVFDPLGQVESLVAPDGATTTYARDANGRVTGVTDPLGRSTSTTFDALGRVTARSNGAGETTTFAHDLLGRQTTVTNPLGEASTYVYDGAGRLVSEADALGNATTFAYDGVGRPVAVADADGNTSSTVFDAAGQVISSTSAGGVTTTVGYDAVGRANSTTDELGNTTSTVFDAAGRPLSETDARGFTRSWAYDPAGRVVSETDALGGVVSFGYDLAGRRTSITDPNGAVRSTVFDVAGNATSSSDPLGNVTSRVFDVYNRQVSVTDPRGETISNTFDVAGQLVGESSSAGDVSHVYDAAGRRVQMLDPTGTTEWSFDAAGRTTQVAAPGGSVSYSFDAAGRRTGMVTPVDTVTSGYSDAGWLTSLTDGAGVHSFSVDGDGRVLTQSRPNGVGTLWSYDAAGRLSGVVHAGPDGVIENFAYGLDGNGNRTSVTSNAGVESYTLDAVQRITEVVYPDGELVGYGYDVAGNRTSVSSSVSGDVSYSLDVAGRLVSDSSGVSYSYDDAGFLTGTSAGDSYTFDAYGRQVSATVDGVTDTAVFDGDGRRVGLNGVAQVWDRAGLGTLVADGTVPVTHGPTGVASVGGEQLLADGLGSVRVMTDAAGVVVDAVGFDVFGAARTGEASLFGFTGEQTDPSGQVHLRARNYLPSLGRFGAGDTVQPNAPGTQGWNLYSYTANNPTTWTDPSGNLSLIETSAATKVRGALASGTQLSLRGVQAAKVLRETDRLYRTAKTLEAVLQGELVAVSQPQSPESQSGAAEPSTTPATQTSGGAPPTSTTLPPAGPCDSPPDPSGQRFYTVQNAGDAARLRSGGAPFPTAPLEAHLGPGVYSWASRSAAEAYRAFLSGQYSTGPLEIVEFEAESGSYRSLDVDCLTDPEGWLDRYSQLRDGRPDHGFDYIVRGVSEAFGREHFFARAVFGRLRFQ